MSWLALASIQSNNAIKYDIINLVGPIYQDKTFTMKFIKKYPYGKKKIFCIQWNFMMP